MTIASTDPTADRFTPRPADLGGFVRAANGRLIDHRDTELLLRGVGLGNWLLAEGYMWRFGQGAESPREIEALVARLAGEEYAAGFWPRFRDAFITEADIARIAACGFDHVRLPINSRIVQDEAGAPIESGYALIDRLIAWCRRHRIRVLLDLHGAPGGQTGTNIDDSPRGMPELFMSDRYRELTVRLWRDLAERYAAEPVVLGYDLLNEPLPNEWQHRYQDELRALYLELTATIRSVDPDHLLVYEGSHWATNWDVFDAVWDPNSLLQFHKYWSAPSRASIAPFLETRDRLGLPIYMGEGGENTLEWLYTAFRLYESEEIGWNFWPWKKLETRTSPVSVIAPEGWDAIVEASRGGARPGERVAAATFDALLDHVRIEQARWRPEVVAALTAQRPAVIPAWGFGHRGEGVSYRAARPSPMPEARPDDGVPIEFETTGEHPSNPFEQSDGRPYRDAERIVAALAAGDWVEYELDPSTTLEGLRLLGPEGKPAAVTAERTARGVRVTASAATRLATLTFDRR